MSTDTPLNLLVDPAAFLAAFADVLGPTKVDEEPVLDHRWRVGARWVNLVDDFMLAAQELVVGLEERIATLESGGTLAADVAALDTRVDALEATPGYSPSFGVPVSVGAANSAGVATTIARSDHVHAASFGTPVPVGDSLSAGVATTAARSDHVHSVSISAVNRVLYDVDFSAQPTLALTNGTRTVDGRGWTVSNATLAGTFAITNGTGFQWVHGTSTGSYEMTAGTQTSPVFEIAAGTLIPGWDPRGTYAFEFYFTTSVLESSARWQFHVRSAAGTPTGSSSRLIGVGRRNLAGVMQNMIMNGSTTQATVNAGTENCMSIVIDPWGRAMQSIGTYASGFPMLESIGILQYTIATLGAYCRADMLVGFSFASTNDATPTDALTVNRMRVLRVG